MSLTADELALTTKLGECMSEFMRLPYQHPNHQEDFLAHIHALQQMVMSRCARDCHPDESRSPRRATPQTPAR